MKPSLIFLCATGLIFLEMRPCHAQWVQTNGPFFSGVSKMYFIPTVDGQGRVGISWGDSSFSSTDHGISWVRDNNLPPSLDIMVSNSNGDIFCGTSTGVFRSTNYGATWENTSNGLSDSAVTALYVDGDVIAGTFNGRIFRSADNGNSWSLLTDTGQIMKPIRCLYSSGGTLLAGTQGPYPPPGTAKIFSSNEDSTGGIYLSTDQGKEWSLVGLSNYTTISIQSTGSILVALIDAAGYSCVEGGCAGIYIPMLSISTNQGLTWSFPINGPDGDAAFSRKGAFTKDNNFFWINQTGTTFTRGDDGWPVVQDGIGQYVSSFTFDNTFLYIGSYGSGVWRCPIAALVGDTIAPNLTLAALSTPAVNAVRFGIGANETLTSAELTVNSQPVTLTKEGDLYFGTYLVNSPGSLNVHASATDLSSNTTQTDRSYTVVDLNKSGNFLNITVKGNDKGYAVLSPSELPQTPSNWEPISSAIEVLNTNPVADISIEAFYSDFNHEDESKIGLYQYQNDNWEYIGGHGRNGKVNATIHGGKIAVFYNPDQVSVPKEFSLSQNYPNPFNPTTRLRYNVASAGKVTMKVYNILGQEVRTLVNAVREPGFYEVTWDGKNDQGMGVSSGMYFYRMEAGKFVQTKKMLFVK